MRLERTHLWNDYYDGSEEEGWQDADPFDKDRQDVLGIFEDESLDENDWDYSKYKKNW